MPAAWSAKDERMYGHIVKSCKKRGRYGLKRCKSIAAATVNKRRRKEGRTLSGLDGYTAAPLILVGAAGAMLAALVDKALAQE